MFSEKQFEDLICQYPELIEEGLTLKGRQITLYGRRMDILFEDNLKRKLIIELKVGPIKDEHVGQILAYEGMLLSSEDPSVRVMLVGNRVPPNLRRSLDHHGIAWKEITIMQLKDLLSCKENRDFLDLLSIDSDRKLSKEKVSNAPTKTVKVIGESSGVWIKQINPKYYRFFDLIQSGEFNKEWWNISFFKEEIKQKHTMLFWLSGKAAGIYAMGEVISNPKIITLDDCKIDYCTFEYNERFPDQNLSRPFFQCRLVRELIDKPVLKEYLRDNPILKILSVIRAPQPTNFRVTKEQWQELKRLYPLLNDAT